MYCCFLSKNERSNCLIVVCYIYTLDRAARFLQRDKGRRLLTFLLKDIYMIVNSESNSELSENGLHILLILYVKTKYCSQHKDCSLSPSYVRTRALLAKFAVPLLQKQSNIISQRYRLANASA